MSIILLKHVSRVVVIAVTLMTLLSATTHSQGNVPSTAPTVPAQAAKQNSKLSQLIQKQMELNAARAEKLEQFKLEEKKLEKELKSKQSQLKRIEEEFDLTQQRLIQFLYTEEVGITLRQQRKLIPNLYSYRRESGQRPISMIEVRGALIDLQNESYELKDLDAAAKKIFQSFGPFSEQEVSSHKDQMRTLLSTRRSLIKKLQAVYRSCLKTLQALELTEKQLVTVINVYSEFLDTRLMWTRGSKAIGLEDLQNLAPALGWFVSLRRWVEVLQDIGTSFAHGPIWWILSLLFAGLLLAGKPLAGRKLAEIAENVGDVHKDSFLFTLRAMLMTICLAAGWPFLMGFVGTKLIALPTAQDFTRAVGTGLMASAMILAKIGLVYHICRSNGLAEVHFKWRDTTRLTLQKNLRWLLWVALPLGFLVFAVKAEDNAQFTDSLGRLAFMLTMITLSVFLVRVIRSLSGVVSLSNKGHDSNWPVQYSFIMLTLSGAMPFVLVLFAAMGYYYTTLSLFLHIRDTVWLAIGLILANDLAYRWLFIARRRLAFEKAERKREMLLARQKEERPPEAGVEGEPIIVEEPEMDLVQIDEQTKSLRRTVIMFSSLLGLWLIWGSVFPALEYIGDIHLWSYRTELDGVTKTVPITLINLATAILVLVITVILNKNMPGALEITLLKRMPLAPGTGYAVTTVCRYIIIVIGIIVAFRIIGITWSSLQWLVAALGVGLGFGLQEIVANFVSGLIILFERPFRVGDVVTVGDTSGTITHIRIRTTTITDWDRRELIVPNKDFITGKVTNWSLSDPITRIVVPVGIVYGSDTTLAEKLLMKVARENQNVLNRPEPSAYFLGFGDNSLNFELRVFIPDPLMRFKITHDLHQAINREFKKAGLVIAFPQRDVHLDTTAPLEVRVVPDLQGEGRL